MIRSTFAGFTTAQLAMSASQRALDVTGQNIANINTLGYTRQRLDISSLNTSGADFHNSNNSIRVGYGVQMTGVSQLRDPFLDMQYRAQMSKLGTADSQVAGLEQLEPIFDETTDAGIRSALENIVSSLDELSKSPNAKELDSMVRSNMQILLNLFHNQATDLESVRNDATQGFATTDIADVNQILENIANLNRSIKNSHILGNPALELQDQRNDLLDQLASYIPIDVKYSEQPVGPGQTVEVLDVSFTTTDGTKISLISDMNHTSFHTDISGQPVTLSVFDLNGGQEIDITNRIESGTIKGTLDFLNKSGDFDNSDFKGIGYYEKVLDSLVGTFAEKLNAANKAVQIGPDGNPVKNPNYDPNAPTDPKDPNYDETKVNEYLLEDRPLFEKINPNADWSASNIKIADGWTNGTYGITNSTEVKNNQIGATDNENILDMIKLFDTDMEFQVNGVKFFTGTFGKCYSNIESTLGVDIRSAETMLKNQISVLNQTANSRDGISGVQLDEEGMNLMHFNQSYTAAARLMTTLDEALETLINKTGVVGR